MSSTLDDMESYEFFQMELDEYLLHYRQHSAQAMKPAVFYIINHFIEYVCFHRFIDSLDSITDNIITEDFPEWLNDAGISEYTTEFMVNTLNDFLKYINNNRKTAGNSI